MENVPSSSAVVICFQISIFEPLETTNGFRRVWRCKLWFAFKLVSLNHWKQPVSGSRFEYPVVICFQISIFEPLETTFAKFNIVGVKVVICFQISIFEPLETTLFVHKCVHAIVVICFQISIFEPLETTEYMLQTNYQLVTHIFRN